MKNQKTVEKQPEQRPALPSSVPRKELSTSGEGKITHPFAEVPDAMYAPPANRNYATIPKLPPQKKVEPAYRTTVPIYNREIASTVYDCAMDTQVTLTHRELLSLSPEVRAQVREATSNKQVAPSKEATKNINILADNPALPRA